MIGSDGLLGPVSVLTLLGLLGFLGATSVIVLVLARKAPPLTTQHNQVTDMTEHGIVTWGAWFYGVLMVLPWTVAIILQDPPILILIILAVAAIVYGRYAWLDRKGLRKMSRKLNEIREEIQPTPVEPVWVDQTTPPPPAIFYPTMPPVTDEFWKRPTS